MYIQVNDFLDRAAREKILKTVGKWENAKAVVLPMLTAGESAYEPMEYLVSRSFFDMSILYYLDIPDFSSVVKVSKGMPERWGISEAELHQAAMENLSKQTVCCKTMKQVLEEMQKEHPGLPNPFSLPSPFAAPDDKPPIYILSNERGTFGAACILLPQVREQVAGVIGTGQFIILPSSRNELIILPDNENADYESLKDVVEEVNNTAVPQRELLSYGVYVCSPTELRKVA